MCTECYDHRQTQVRSCITDQEGETQLFLVRSDHWEVFTPFCLLADTEGKKKGRMEGWKNGRREGIRTTDEEQPDIKGSGELNGNKK